MIAGNRPAQDTDPRVRFSATIAARNLVDFFSTRKWANREELERYVRQRLVDAYDAGRKNPLPAVEPVLTTKGE